VLGWINLALLIIAVVAVALYAVGRFTGRAED
jgi:hypothetical protein